MEITREYLEQKLTEYNVAAARYKADADANYGAAQVIQELLDHLNAPAPATETKNK